MDLEGIVHNGVIVPDNAQVLAEGTRVRIEPLRVEQRVEPARTPAEILAGIAALPLKEGPEFSGRDHDKILYGAKGSS